MTRLPPPQERFDILYRFLEAQLLSDSFNVKLIHLYFEDLLPIYLSDKTVLREGQARFLHMVISDVHPSAVDGDVQLFRELQKAFIKPSTLLPSA
jgi:hypothetical protein